MHGADRIGGLSSANGLVFGRRAGKAAAAYALSADDEVEDAPHAISYAQDASDRSSTEVVRLPLPTSVDAAAMTDKLRRTMQRSAMLPRTAEGLTDALSKLEELERRVRARDSHSGATRPSSEMPASTQAQAATLDTQLLLGRAMLTAMLARAESRGAHFRADFPEQNENYDLPVAVRLSTSASHARIS